MGRGFFLSGCSEIGRHWYSTGTVRYIHTYIRPGAWNIKTIGAILIRGAATYEKQYSVQGAEPTLFYISSAWLKSDCPLTRVCTVQYVCSGDTKVGDFWSVRCPPGYGVV